jgi:hypothetical protein
MLVRRLFILLLGTSLTGCLQVGRTNARIEEGFDVALGMSLDYYKPVTDTDGTKTDNNGSASFWAKLQYAGRLPDGSAVAVQANVNWPALDVYYALAEDEGDRWFFGVGVEGGLWGENFGAGLYGVGTLYFGEIYYLTFTPRISFSDDFSDMSEEEGPHRSVWFNPQIAFGVDAAGWVDLSVFAGHARLAGDGVGLCESCMIFYRETYRKSIWMLGGQARF